jgi:hypothetical protein
MPDVFPWLQGQDTLVIIPASMVLFCAVSWHIYRVEKGLRDMRDKLRKASDQLKTYDVFLPPDKK